MMLQLRYRYSAYAMMAAVADITIRHIVGTPLRLLRYYVTIC